MMSETILDLLIETTLRATVLIIATYAITQLLRHAAAAIHHWIWLLTLTTILILPVWLLIAPTWSLSIMSPEQHQSVAPATPTQYFSRNIAPISQMPAVEQRANLPAESTQLSAIVPPLDSGPQQPTDPATVASKGEIIQQAPNHFTLKGKHVVLILWLSGVLVCSAYWFRGQLIMLWITQQATPITDPTWTTMARRIAASLNLKRSVALMGTNRVTIPITWGFWRSTVFLPLDAHTWSAERQRIVLQHELVHIKRGDSVTQWVALLCCTLNWFNPLVWWASRRLSVECERACDDRVLNLGTPKIDYATHLVEIARNKLRLPNTIKAFGRKSELTQRVRNILKPSHSRRSLSWTRSFAIGLCYISLITLPLSTIVPGPTSTNSSSMTQSEVVLQLAIPGHMTDFINAEMLREFENANPGVQVVINVVEPLPPAPFGADDEYFEEYYRQVEQFASAGDVALIRTPQFVPALTMPGYFLDLKPLVSADADLDVNDFFPAAWESFQWDNGIWALPTHWNQLVMSYDPDAFDAVGLAYPTANWTLDDLVSATRLLTNADTYGLEILPWAGDFPIIRSLLGESLIDTSQTPHLPRFDVPGLATLLYQWVQFKQEHLVGPDMSAGGGSIDDIMNPDVPMRITSIEEVVLDGRREIAPLPGGHTNVLGAGGVTVSAGTQYPEQAYALAKFLTTQPQVYSVYGDSTAPARRSLFQSDANGLSAELQPHFEALAPTAIPFSEARFANYLSNAMREVRTNNLQGLQIEDVLAEQKLLAETWQANVMSRAGTFTLTIPPAVAVDVAPGETVLRFGYQSFIQPLPNQRQWDQVISDFVTNNPDVAHIDLRLVNNPVDYAAEFDCFYTPFTLTAFDAVGLLNLDPLMNSDPAFDTNDFLPGVLDRVRIDNRTFGYPLSIQPQILQYNVAAFQRMGIPEPANNWTTTDFVTTLQTIHAITGETVLNTHFGIPEHLFILIQSFGGLPIDNRTSPPSADFTSPQNVEAIRSVLDLVRQGYIGYQPSSNMAANPMITSYLGWDSGGTEGWNYVFYPSGDHYTPVSIGVGSAYISREAVNPEACYRWISTISANPDLIGTMPARTSSSNDARLSASQSNDAIALYQHIDELMRQPNTIVTTTAFAGEKVETALMKHWLHGAFDAYIMEGMPLENALADAQIVAEAYLECASNVSLDSSQDMMAYSQAHEECAMRVDPNYHRD